MDTNSATSDSQNTSTDIYGPLPVTENAGVASSILAVGTAANRFFTELPPHRLALLVPA
jgi:hypothetical protein